MQPRPLRMQQLPQLSSGLDDVLFAAASAAVLFAVCAAGSAVAAFAASSDDAAPRLKRGLDGRTEPAVLLQEGHQEAMISFNCNSSAVLAAASFLAGEISCQWRWLCVGHCQTADMLV